MSPAPETRRHLAYAALIVLLAVVSGCTSRPEPTPAGYTGTWSMGNERVKSILYIIDNDNGTWFQWRRWTAEGKLRVDCNWDGSCQGYNEGQVYSEYQFDVRKDTESGHLIVECRGTMFEPREAEIYYVDEMVLENDQRTLVAYTLRQMDDVYESGRQPHRRFDKVSDGVPDPPAGAFGE